MAAFDQVFDSLPYIDAEPSQAQREHIITTLNADLPANASEHLHALVPLLVEPSLTPIARLELERVAAEGKLSAIDKSRYEALDPPEHSNADAAAWRTAVRRAYGAHSHLAARESNLGMLEESGKNGWLIGNFQLEQELKVFEKQLAETTNGTEATNHARKAVQEAARGELEALEEAWRTGVGRMLEVEVASEKLRLEALDLQRRGATG